MSPIDFDDCPQIGIFIFIDQQKSNSKNKTVKTRSSGLASNQSVCWSIILYYYYFCFCLILLKDEAVIGFVE